MHGLSQGPYNLAGYSTAAGVFGAMNALGTLAFAYGGHNVVLEIQVHPDPFLYYPFQLYKVLYQSLSSSAIQAQI